MLSKIHLSPLASILCFLSLAPSLNAANFERKESETAVPGLSYGEVEDLPNPKTIFFGAGIDNILADAERWKERGIDAFFVDYVAREWSTDIWSTDGKPWTIGESDETLQKAKRAAAICRENEQQTFLKIAFDHHLDWFDDILWQRANNNFRHLRARGRFRWDRPRYRVHQRTVCLRLGGLRLR